MHENEIGTIDSPRHPAMVTAMETTRIFLGIVSTIAVRTDPPRRIACSPHPLKSARQIGVDE